ncbi:MAG: serine/threonine-protein kinase, partial [Methylomonas sp.]|nr:serine/threonine-protein kinase [Methylomonas sp.]
MTDEDQTRVQAGGKTRLPDSIYSSSSQQVRSTAQDTSAVEFPLATDSDHAVVTSTPDATLSASSESLLSSTPASGQSAESQQTTPRLGVGELLKGRFQIVEILGEGGMGVVFKAVDSRKLEARSKNPYVAIKVLNPALASNPTLIAGLQRECEKAQELSHPNIITVYDFDRDGDKVFMSMEYLVGRPLTGIIRQAGDAGGIQLEKAWPIIRQMGQALAYAHKKNIVHSDFKPANVFVTE